MGQSRRINIKAKHWGKTSSTKDLEAPSLTNVSVRFKNDGPLRLLQRWLQHPPYNRGVRCGSSTANLWKPKPREDGDGPSD
jgi:hypothetical protein